MAPLGCRCLRLKFLLESQQELCFMWVARSVVVVACIPAVLQLPRCMLDIWRLHVESWLPGGGWATCDTCSAADMVCLASRTFTAQLLC